MTTLVIGWGNLGKILVDGLLKKKKKLFLIYKIKIANKKKKNF